MELKAMATGAGVAAICLTVGFVLWKRKKTPKLVGWLALIAGFGIGGGLLGALLHQGGTLIARAASTGTELLLGVALPAAVVVGIGLWIGLDLWPKHKPSKALPVLALLFPILLATVGGMLAGLGNGVLNTLGDSVQTVMVSLMNGGT